MNELKPEDVMRALEKCVDGECCNECPYFEKENCLTKLHTDALALLREKDALIEDYRQELGRARVALNDANAEIEWLKLEIQARRAHQKSWDTVRTEAIDEFAQRLKARYITLPHYCDTTKEVLAIVNGSIDKIAKEMKGDQDA